MAGKSKKHDSVQLKNIQSLVRAGQYVLTDHAFEPIQEGDIDLNDFECSVKNGVITKVQNDEMKNSKDGKKYTIVGPTFNGLPIASTGKIINEGAEDDYLLITINIAF